MPESDVDLRQWQLVLLSHEVFTGPSAAAVVDWAARQNVGLYQLPLPAHALRPRTASGRLSRPTVAELAFEQKELEAVFADLASYRSAGYQVLGLIVTSDLSRTKAGRDWLTRVQELARREFASEPNPVIPGLASGRALTPAPHTQPNPVIPDSDPGTPPNPVIPGSDPGSRPSGTVTGFPTWVLPDLPDLL
jgi:hypothetical protein